MKRDIERLKSEEFDILVIGGGINGCAIARDAALRGAKAALVEKNDFASGASGKTTKLIHGGIRYLEQLNLKLVYEALHERAGLLRNAPSLVRPLKFAIPVYKDSPRSFLKIKTGVSLYDLLAGKENICRHRTIKKEEASSLFPSISKDNLKGAVIYCDAQMDDIRLCLDNAISAYEQGACTANKVEVSGFIKENSRIVAAECRDTLNSEKFTVKAKVFVNATGAWSNRLVKMDEPDSPAITRPTKGVHIVYRKILKDTALLLSAHQDKRVIFCIPWRDFTLIGTTDTDFSGSADEVYPQQEDIEYLLEEAKKAFPDERIDKSGIISAYAGLRPLINSQGFPPWKVSREHLIKTSASGLVSVVGGKYTTFRRLAEDVVDKVLPRIEGKKFTRCATAGIALSAYEQKKSLEEAAAYAVKEEMANSLTDLMVRRLQLYFTGSSGFGVVERCAGVMAVILGWDEQGKTAQIHSYKEEVRKNTHSF